MSNRTAFVTGGAQGIGQGIATTLGAHGFSVAVVDLNLDAAQATAASITEAGGVAVAVHADVTDTGSVQAAVKSVTDGLGPVEIAVNNGGSRRLSRAPRPEVRGPLRTSTISSPLIELETLLVEPRGDGVGVLTVNRPSRSNSQTATGGLATIRHLPLPVSAAIHGPAP